MKGRFGRRRRRSDDPRRAAIDASWLQRAAEDPGLSLEAVEPVTVAGVPDSFARVGRGVDRDGRSWLVTVSPSSGGDALLAALAASSEDPQEERPQRVALSPSWDAASRLRLGVLEGGGVRARRLAGAAAEEVAPQALGSIPLPPRQLVAQLVDPERRALLERALDILGGLAAKHVGGLRAVQDRVELVLCARPVVALGGLSDPLLLEIQLPARSSLRLSEADLPEAFDRLEGQIRKRLNDRKVRDGEEGLRGRLLGRLAGSAGLRDLCRWPLGGAGEAIDCAALAGEGTAVLVAVRERLGLEELAGILDAALYAEPWLPALLGGAAPPVLLSARVRWTLAAREIDDAARAVLAHLQRPLELFEIGAGDSLRRVELGAATSPSVAIAPPLPAAAAELRPAGEEGEGEERERSGGGGRGRRRRRGRGRRAPGEATGGAKDSQVREEVETRYEELSLLDLDDEAEDPSPRRRRRRRGRGGRSGGTGGAEEESEQGGGGEPTPAAGLEPAPEETAPERGSGRRRRRGGRPSRAREAADAEEEDELVPLAPDAPDEEEVVLGVYEEDEEGEPESERDRILLERERRRRARNAKLAPVTHPVLDPEAAEMPRSLPRGRAAILACADRDSIAAAVLLARDVRQIEGIWVYPQEDLMTFFRRVATDMRDSTPIYVVGFVARPPRDALQAAALYRGRLLWFDHHEWPPEDLEALRSAIGAAFTQVTPGVGSSLPAVLGFCTRRSRFSDKLVDLLTGRFSHHDFQRWGRLWWHRLGALANRPGERHADLELLLAGRPSDLAKEAATAEVPPAPEELAFVAGRDFRLIHFGGLGLVVLEVPPHLDMNLSARIARERYGVVISLARRQGGALVLLSADEGSGRRSIDLAALAEHLAEKFAWVELLSDSDYVARFRVRGCTEQPERIDELVAEVGMGRSILEG